MRRLHDRGYWVWLIAQELEVSKETADHHIHGHCTHVHDSD
jgi:orotate phosphoribosyltransferase-like protein